MFLLVFLVVMHKTAAENGRKVKANQHPIAKRNKQTI